MFKTLILGTALLAQAASQTGCGSPTPVTEADTARSNRISDHQVDMAVQAAAGYQKIRVGNNGEIDNIVKYVNETTRPGLVGYVTLLTLGRPIAYYAVKGPVTDCARELTPMQHPIASYIPIAGSNSSGSNRWTSFEAMGDSPNDEGTYGGNEHCHFFYTESGVLIRWTGELLYSDAPIRLTEKPLVIQEVSVKK